MGTPVDFETNGTVREERGFASSTYTSLSASSSPTPVTASWTLSRPTVSSARAMSSVTSRTRASVSSPRRARRRRNTGGVARVDARALDVLHHAAEQHVIPVRYGVDVQFDRVVEELVD